MRIIPLSRDAANKFVDVHHRHNRPVVGHRYALGLVHDGELVGVAIVGNPIARGNADGVTAEVTRLCVSSDAPRNACSKLYSACQRVWFAMGGLRLVTYTLQSESGASLRGAGWKLAGVCGGRQWDCPSRRRARSAVQSLPKFRWEKKAEAV